MNLLNTGSFKRKSRVVRITLKYDVLSTQESRSIYILWVRQFCIFRHKNVLKICLTTQKSSQVTDNLKLNVFASPCLSSQKVTVNSLFLWYDFTIKEAHLGQKAQKRNRKWQFLLFFTQQYSWAQDRIEFFWSATRDVNAILFNSSGVSLVHFLCT